MWLRIARICLPVALLMCACTVQHNADLSRSSATPGAVDQRPTPILSQQESRKLLDAGQFKFLDAHFSAVQADYESGASSDEDLRNAFRVFYDTDSALAPLYDQWISHFPKSYVARVARGLYYAKVGQSVRGVKSTEKTHQRNFDEMEVAFDKAMRDLSVSLRLTRKPLLTYSYEMIVSTMHGDGAESRRLLDRATQIDPHNFVVRARYMTAIETRWGGSQDLMKAFLEECRRANFSDNQLRLLDIVVAEDEGWTHLYIDGNYPAAEAAYRRSATLGGDRNLANITDAMMKQSKYQEVIEPLTEELSDSPGDPGILDNRGEAYMKSGKPREAIADWTAAAAAGSAYAQNELGILNMTGVPGVLNPDINAGINFFRQSAAQGNSLGQQNLQRALILYPPPPTGNK
jgi:tetratricopeptide (TPR) repeat protein